MAGGSKLVHAPTVGEALQLDSAVVQIDIENVRVSRFAACRFSISNIWQPGQDT